MTTHATSDLCDRFGDRVQLCRAALKSYGGRHAASGAIACVRTFEDAALLRTQLGQPGDGRLLLVDAGASQRVAVLGDHMARIGIENGWRGVVVNGAVRDVNRLAAMDFVVLALGSVPLRGGNAGLGETGVELGFGGAVFVPGAFVCLDGDGVIVLPQPPG